MWSYRELAKYSICTILLMENLLQKHLEESLYLQLDYLKKDKRIQGHSVCSQTAPDLDFNLWQQIISIGSCGRAHRSCGGTAYKKYGTKKKEYFESV